MSVDRSQRAAGKSVRSVVASRLVATAVAVASASAPVHHQFIHANAPHATAYPTTIPARCPTNDACGTMMDVKMSDPNGARFTGSWT